jgi:hypothetical protein
MTTPPLKTVIDELPQVKTPYPTDTGLESWVAARDTLNVYPGMEPGSVLMIVQHRHDTSGQHVVTLPMDAAACQHLIGLLQAACKHK